MLVQKSMKDGRKCFGNDITVVMDSFVMYLFDWWICDIVFRWYVNTNVLA